MLGTLLNCAFWGLMATATPFIDVEEVAGTPVVAWLTPREHDFGTIRHEHPVEYIFKFKNIAAEAITIEAVRTTCGCTAASWTESAIAPGATGEVRIEYDAYQRGDFSKKIKVFFDKQRKADVLKISGSVE
jgi:Protein of unknown function (DUF1573)